MNVITRMLPTEVRAIPGFVVVADLGLTNPFASRTIPLIAAATVAPVARHLGVTIPAEFVTTTKSGGAGAMHRLSKALLSRSLSDTAAFGVMLALRQASLPRRRSSSPSAAGRRRAASAR